MNLLHASLTEADGTAQKIFPQNCTSIGFELRLSRAPCKRSCLGSAMAALKADRTKPIGSKAALAEPQRDRNRNRASFWHRVAGVQSPLGARSFYDNNLYSHSHSYFLLSKPRLRLPLQLP
jgi:hypothetical protein